MMFSLRLPFSCCHCIPAAVIVGVIVAATSPRAVQAADDSTALVILPSEVSLAGPKYRQQVLVERKRGGDFVGQVADGLTWESSDRTVADITNGIIVPVGNGKAIITVRLTSGGESASVPVHVTNMDRPFSWSFRNHVQSVLAKTGCNSGACHGAVAGKKGFRLSLRGYDADGDYHVLARQARGRRISLADPGRSLMLTKATATLTHGGGQRFAIGSPEYQVVSEWIAAGAPPPAENDPRIERIDVFPSAAVLSPKAVQQLVVQARFSDGRVEDVTRWAKFSSTNGEVAAVDDAGRVTIAGPGEGSVSVWYLNKLVVATMTVPRPQVLPEGLFTNAPRRNPIDNLVLAKLKRLNIPPSGRSTDSEFLRRAMLDTIGVLPTADEVKSFLADKATDKRDRLIEQLLDRPEFVDYWTYKWSDLLLVNSDKLKPASMWAYSNWIRHHVAANTPWDAMVRDLILAQGSTQENGATNFFVLHQDTRDLVETVSQAFLGMSINCARCHNHPLEKWTNAEYYGMANLLARVRIKDAGGEGHFTVFAAPEGNIVQPLTGMSLPPKPLDGTAIPLDAPGDRRHVLADWLVSPENPYFTRAIVNRVWANFMGAGIVEKVDDLRFTNPPSNPLLMAELTRSLVNYRYDLKSLMRLILQSETYQRSSEPVPGNEGDRRFYARYYPRRLMAEVMNDAIVHVTGVPTSWPNYPSAWRATQLPDSRVASYFLEKFGRPDRAITCDCERTNEPNMVQVLHLANGDVINQKLTAKENQLGRWLASNKSDEAMIDELYLSALARYPTESEKAGMLPLLREATPEERRPVLEDIAWSILGSKEFLFNH